jgi:hypothetical protein
MPAIAQELVRFYTLLENTVFELQKCTKKCSSYQIQADKMLTACPEHYLDIS